MRIGHVPGNISLPKGQFLCLIPEPPMAWGHHDLPAWGRIPRKGVGDGPAPEGGLSQVAPASGKGTTLGRSHES